MNKENAANVNTQKKRLSRPDDVQRGSAQGLSGSGQKLKSERVQMPAARVRELLSGMPGWKVTSSGQAIGKKLSFPQPQVAASYAAYVAGLAAAEGQRVQIALAGAAMTLTLNSRLRGTSRNGITENDFRFAARLG